eukprot:CFRG5290T1
MNQYRGGASNQGSCRDVDDSLVDPRSGNTMSNKMTVEDYSNKQIARQPARLVLSSNSVEEILSGRVRIGNTLSALPGKQSFPASYDQLVSVIRMESGEHIRDNACVSNSGQTTECQTSNGHPSPGRVSPRPKKSSSSLHCLSEEKSDRSNRKAGSIPESIIPRALDIGTLNINKSNQTRKPLQRLKYSSAPVHTRTLDGKANNPVASTLKSTSANPDCSRVVSGSSCSAPITTHNAVDRSIFIPASYCSNSRSKLQKDGSISLVSESVVTFKRLSKVGTKYIDMHGDRMPEHENKIVCKTECKALHEHITEHKRERVVTFSMYDQVFEIPIEDRKGKWKEEGLQLYEQQAIVDSHPDLGSALDVLNKYDDWSSHSGFESANNKALEGRSSAESGVGLSGIIDFRQQLLHDKSDSNVHEVLGLGASGVAINRKYEFNNIKESILDGVSRGNESAVNNNNGGASMGTSTGIENGCDDGDDIEDDVEADAIAKADRFATAAAHVIDIDGNARAEFVSVREEDDTNDMATGGIVDKVKAMRVRTEPNS